MRRMSNSLWSQPRQPALNRKLRMYIFFFLKKRISSWGIQKIFGKEFKENYLSLLVIVDFILKFSIRWFDSREIQQISDFLEPFRLSLQSFWLTGKHPMFKSLSKHLMNSVQRLIVQCVFSRLDNTEKDIFYPLDARELEVSRKAAALISPSTRLNESWFRCSKKFTTP